MKKHEITKECMTALEQSIVHWKANVRSTPCVELSVGSCALCKLYYKGGECDHCIILKDTGVRTCEKTPYSAVSRLDDDIVSYNYGEYGGILSEDDLHGELEIHVEEMLAYLIDLKERCVVSESK